MHKNIKHWHDVNFDSIVNLIKIRRVDGHVDIKHAFENAVFKNQRYSLKLWNELNVRIGK